MEIEKETLALNVLHLQLSMTSLDVQTPYLNDAESDSDDESPETRFRLPEAAALPETYRLELILGPVRSGKSTELCRRIKIRSLYKKVVGVNTKEDTRYGDSGIITHDGLRYPCLRVSNLQELLSNPQYQEAQVVGIDEGNFFPEIFDFVSQQLEVGDKTFIISGLNGDKDKKFFGSLHHLIPHADKIDMLRALCKRCGNGTEAAFSINLEHFDGQKKVGGAEMFDAVCRKHYNDVRYLQSIDRIRTSSPGLKISIQ